MYRAPAAEQWRTQRDSPAPLLFFFLLFLLRFGSSPGAVSGPRFDSRACGRRVRGRVGHDGFGDRRGNGVRMGRGFALGGSFLPLFVTIVTRTFSRVRAARRNLAGVIAAQTVGHVVVDRTGVGHLLGDAEFLQFLDDLARLYFQLSRQFIDSNLTHSQVIFYLPALTALPVKPCRRTLLAN
jgi:hypothetical protein